MLTFNSCLFNYWPHFTRRHHNNTNIAVKIAITVVNIIGSIPKNAKLPHRLCANPNTKPLKDIPVLKIELKVKAPCGFCADD